MCDQDRREAPPARQAGAATATPDGHAFAVRHGRIEIMECEHVKYLCKEHLGLDVLISLPKPPPR
jgi:hypothetical protein